MANLDLPERAMRQQIASAINVVIQVSRMSDGTRKIMQISEMTGYKDDQPILNDIFRLQRDPAGDVTFVATGNIPHSLSKMEMAGVYTDQAIFSSEPYHVEATSTTPGAIGDMPVEEVVEAVGDTLPAGDIHVQVPLDSVPLKRDQIVISAPPFDPALDTPPPPGDGAARPKAGPEPTPDKSRSVSEGGLLRRRQENRAKSGENPQK